MTALCCPRCAEDRLVERIGVGAFCAVCAHTWAPPPEPALSGAELEALVAEILRRHLTEGPWSIVAVAPVATLSRPLQTGLAHSFAVDTSAVLLVFEPARGRP